MENPSKTGGNPRERPHVDFDGAFGCRIPPLGGLEWPGLDHRNPGIKPPWIGWENRPETRKILPNRRLGLSCKFSLKPIH